MDKQIEAARQWLEKIKTRKLNNPCDDVIFVDWQKGGGRVEGSVEDSSILEPLPKRKSDSPALPDQEA